MSTIKTPVSLNSLVFLLGFFFCSCDHTKNEDRPSPLAMDSARIGSTKVKIVYSSPSVKKRAIWGELVPYQQVWRTGANQATWLEVDSDVLINGDRLPAGRYGVFTIPDPNSWTFIFNKDWEQWGAYNYESSKDVLRTKVIPGRTEKSYEELTFSFEDNSLVFHWEHLKLILRIDELNTAK